MKDKILQQLKTKYSNLGLSVKTLEGFAEQLANGVTEETQIEGAVQGAEFYLKIAQAEADRVRQDAKKNTHPEPQKPEPPKNNDVPEWQKAIEALTNQVSALTKQTVVSTRKEQFVKNLSGLHESIVKSKLKDFERMNFETDEDFQTYLSETQSDANLINQELINSGLKSNVPQGQATKKAEDAQVLKDIESWASKQADPKENVK